MLLADQFERLVTGFVSGLQEALGDKDFALLQQRPERVMVGLMATRHLLGLLHHRQRARQFALAVVHFAGHRGGDDAAVVAGQRQEFQRFGRQPLGFFRFAGVDRHRARKASNSACSVWSISIFCSRMVRSARSSRVLTSP